jgi:hypothetical protein
MVDVVETATWETAVRRIISSDRVKGGADSDAPNMPHQQLANRTQYLKSLLVVLYPHTVSSGGTAGVTWTHDIGDGNYSVTVTAQEDTGGDLGDVWTSQTPTSVTVYNTGATGISLRVHLWIPEPNIP